MEIYSACMAEEIARLAELRLCALPGRADGHPPGPLRLALFLVQAAWALLWQGRRCDVILIGDLVLFPCAVLARVAAPRARVIQTLHGTDLAFGQREGVLAGLYRLYLGLVRRLAGCADDVVANSQATAALARRIGLRRVRVVPLGVRLPPETAAEPVGRHLLFVGRVTARKGVGWFAETVLPRLAPDIRLRVVGTVWDRAEGERLRRNPRVEMAGPMFGTELARERRRALAVILPNRRLAETDFVEGFGLAAVEAAAAGGVVLAAALDGLVDAVRDGETGFLLPSDRPEAWAAKISEIAAWPAARRQGFVAGLRPAVERHYAWDRVARETLAQPPEG